MWNICPTLRDELSLRYDELMKGGQRKAGSVVRLKKILQRFSNVQSLNGPRRLLAKRLRPTLKGMRRRFIYARRSCGPRARRSIQIGHGSRAACPKQRMVARAVTATNRARRRWRRTQRVHKEFASALYMRLTLKGGGERGLGGSETGPHGRAACPEMQDGQCQPRW